MITSVKGICPVCGTQAMTKVSEDRWACEACKAFTVFGNLTAVTAVQTGTVTLAGIIAERDEARESYRLANRRIIELLDVKMALEREIEQLRAEKGLPE